MKTILITGATSGIGLAAAKKLANKKNQLILCGRRQRKLDEISDELSKSTNVLSLSFDVSKETVNCTNFNHIKIGDLVNIEKSLRVGDEISGHFVFGHVDDTASLVSSIKIGGSYELKFKISKKLSKFIAKKGSIAINGISLTINNFKKGEIYLNIIPYTWKKTNLNKLKVGDRINLEVDMLARYVTQNR